jgi:hypothetical protein
VPAVCRAWHRPIVAGKPGSTIGLDAGGIERAVLVVRRAEIAQPRMRLAFDVRGKRRRQPRLADARLAGNQHHPSFAAFCLLPTPSQIDFFAAPDERCLPPSARPRTGSLRRFCPTPARRATARQSRQVVAARGLPDQTARQSAGGSLRRSPASSAGPGSAAERQGSASRRRPRAPALRPRRCRHIALKPQILQPGRYVHAVIPGSEEQDQPFVGGGAIR